MKWLLDIIYPQTITELTVTRLRHTFPLHISTHKLVDKTNRKIFRVTALADYSDYKVSALVQSLKYTHNYEAIEIISKVLGDYLLDEVASYVTAYPGGVLRIVPMPLSTKRKRKRGFNQTELLLREVVRQHPDLSEFVNMQILIKHRDTVPQTHLNRKERLQNVNGAFKITSETCAGLDVILIDDVLTTGATALEASKTLMQAGAKSVNILTIARTL